LSLDLEVSLVGGFLNEVVLGSLDEYMDV